MSELRSRGVEEFNEFNEVNEVNEVMSLEGDLPQRYIVGLKASDVKRLVMEAVSLGVMQAVKAYEPAADWVRKKDLLEWLKIVDADYSDFRRLEKAGLVRCKRSGDSERSPIVYSKVDVMEAFLTRKLCATIFSSARDELAQIGDK